jgi:hypothetical protein
MFNTLNPYRVFCIGQPLLRPGVSPKMSREAGHGETTPQRA